MLETGFLACFWDSSLRSLKTECKYLENAGSSLLVPLCMKPVGRQGESFDIQRIRTKENIHPFFLGWIFNSPGVLWAVVYCQKFSPGTEKSVLLPYSFKTVCRQSRCLDLIVIGPVPCCCLWFLPAFISCSPREAHTRAFLDLYF